MAKKVLDSDDDILKNELLSLATAEGPRRLIGAGDHPPLFKATAAERRVAKTCTDSSPPLVTVEGSARKATVRLTAAGFNLIADKMPPEAVGPRAKEIAEGLPTADRIEFLQSVVARAPIATADLLPVLEAAVADERADREAESARQAKLLAAEEASLAALEKWKATLERRRQDKIAALKQQLAALGESSEGVEVSPPEEPIVNPSAPEDFDFRRQTARRLVSSWLEAWRMDKAEAREFLEAAIGNLSGVRQIGEEGETAAFDGAHHQSNRPVRDSEPVKVIRPGWVLDDERGEYMLAPAEVT